MCSVTVPAIIFPKLNFTRLRKRITVIKVVLVGWLGFVFLLVCLHV